MKTGSLVFVKLGDKISIGETSMSFSSTATAIDVSNKNSGLDTNVEGGRVNRTITVNGIGDSTPSATAFGLKEALDAQASAAKVEVSITSYTDKTAATEVTGDYILTGSGIITDVSWEAPDNAAQTFNLTIQIDGALTVGTVVAPAP